MTPEEERLLHRILEEKEVETLRRARAEVNSATTIFGGVDATNLIEWQLDFRKELEEIEHLLRGHVIKKDEKKNEIWQEAQDKSGVIFNERGVQEILKLIRMYLNKNLILSNYDEKTINQRLLQFSQRLASEIYLNYEEYGLDSEYKQKHFMMIVMNITDMVEAAYNRAFMGGERESLRTARTVTQTDPMQRYPSYPMSQSRPFSVFKPSTWGRT